MPYKREGAVKISDHQVRLDAATGKLTEAGKAPGGAAKAGPRQLAFHPTQPLAFTADESGSGITAYRFEPASGLKPVQTLSTSSPAGTLTTWALA